MNMNPFAWLAIYLDESRRENLDGSWDKYWARKNRRRCKHEKNRKRVRGL